jgi:putative transposase
VNFFERRAKCPNFKLKFGKQSIQYPQGVSLKGSEIFLPKIGLVKGVVHREIAGTIIKTVTVVSRCVFQPIVTGHFTKS